MFFVAGLGAVSGVKGSSGKFISAELTILLNFNMRAHVSIRVYVCLPVSGSISLSHHLPGDFYFLFHVWCSEFQATNQQQKRPK